MDSNPVYKAFGESNCIADNNNNNNDRDSEFELNFRTLGKKGEEFLYFKYLSGNLPGQTLLTEMLSSGAKMRQEDQNRSLRDSGLL